VSNLKIDKVTVWDNGSAGANGKTRTADFLSGMAGAIPPLHEIARNAGIRLPEYLGKPAEETPVAPAIASEPEEV
jgi:flotillin